MKHSSDIEERTSKQVAWEKIKNDLIAAEKSIREEGTVSAEEMRNELGIKDLALHRIHTAKDNVYRIFGDKMNMAEKSIREHGYYSEEEVEEELAKM